MAISHGTASFHGLTFHGFARMYQNLLSSLHSLSKSGLKTARKRARAAQSRMRRQAFSVEALELRAMMTGVPPTLAALDVNDQPIADGGTITVAASSPLWIPLDGADADGGKLTYTVTSSNPSVIAAPRLGDAGDQWARITVRGFGDMVVHLFNAAVPRAAGRFSDLAQAGVYNTTATKDSTFHRVAQSTNPLTGQPEDFVIQGGITTGSQGDQTAFDDQFSLDLQHNRTGMLSLAKQGGELGDYTNTTQWFITAAPTSALRSLDYNHSVFGMLVEGESVRAAIQHVPTNSSDAPVTPVIIDKIQIFDDVQDNVMLLKAPDGVSSGSSQITVQVRDEQGNVTVKTFTVNVVQDQYNGSPFIADTTPVNVTGANNAIYQLQVLDAEGDTAPSNLAFTASIVGTAPAGVSVAVDTSGVVTVTRPAGFTGSVQVDADVKQVSPAVNTIDSTGDHQRLTFNFSPAAPSSIALDAASDTGYSNSDGITNASSLNFVVSGLTANAQVKLFANGTQVGQANVGPSATTANVVVASSALALGSNVITAKQVIGGAESAVSTDTTVTYDPLILDFTSATSATAEGNVPFTYDANNPEEQPGLHFSYALVNNPPAGMQIDSQTGVVTWTPTQLGTFNFTVRGTDAAGNTKDLTVSVGVTAVRYAAFTLQLTDLTGTPISTLQKGQEFYLVGTVHDLRADATGVRAAYFDVAFDATLAIATGAIEHGDTFTQDPSGSVESGIINEVGGTTASTSLAGATTQLFRIKMQATKVGALQFSGNAADVKASAAQEAPSSQTATALDATNILFNSVSLEVVANFTLVDGTFNTNEDTAGATFDVLAGATKPANETLTLVSLGMPSQGGTVTIENGKVLYKPFANFFGEETFTFTVKNSAGDLRTATATIEVAGVNDPPAAVSDAFSAGQDSATQTFDVLKNDLIAPDAEEVLTVKSVSAGSAGGAISIDSTGKAILYKPAKSFTGTETFTYTVSDPGGLTSTATVTVTVSDVNDPPTLVADVINVGQNTTNFFLNVLANDSTAPDTGETLAITAKTDPLNGTLKLVDGKLLYTPKAGFRGSDTFTYTATDSRGGVSTAQVTLRVADSNAPPIAVNDVVTTPRNTGATINVLQNDTSLPDQNEGLVIIATTQGTNGKVTIVGGTLRYEPSAGFTGTDTFTYTITDPLGATATASVTVTVTPIAPSDISGVVFIDTNTNGIRDTNESGVGGVVIALAGTSTDGVKVTTTATTTADGSYSFTNLDPGSYVVTEPQPGFLLDGQALPGSSLGTATSANSINVNIGQEATHAVAMNFSEAGRKAQFFKLYELFGSTSRHSLLAAVQAGQSSANFTQVNGTAWSAFQSVNVSLAADRGSITINVVDANGTHLRSTVPTTDTRIHFLGKEGLADLIRISGLPSSFSLTAVSNVAPSFTVGANQTVLEDAAQVTAANFITNASFGPADEVGQTVSYNVAVDKPELFEQVPAITAEGSLSFKVKANAVGVAVVTVIAKDSGGTANGGQDTSAPQKFNITITGVNDQPKFTKGADQAIGDNAGPQTVANWATGIAAGGGADETSQTLAFAVTTNNPNLFTVAPQVAANGTLTYTPKDNTQGTATVTVVLKDNGGVANGGVDSKSDTFTINVTGVNQPPVAGGDTPTTVEDTPVTINVLANDSDPDGDTLTVALLAQPAHGAVVLNPDKTITYTPASNFAGSDTFNYELRDGQGGVTAGLVNVTVTNVNNAPVAADDLAALDEDANGTINLAANDTDADSGDTLNYAVTTQPAHGTASVVLATGVATYTPAADFFGTDTFTYTITDLQGATDTATVTISVNSLNDPPVINLPDGQQTLSDSPLVFSSDTENGVTITDVDAATARLEVTLSIDPSQGTLTLGDTSGLQITTGGDGADQTLIVFQATLTDIAAALNNLTYNPATGYVGVATIHLQANDQGNTGSGGANTVTADLDVEVIDPDAEAASIQSSDISDANYLDSVDQYMAAS